MEIAIGEPGKALCLECEEAGCNDHPNWPHNECEKSDEIHLASATN